MVTENYMVADFDNYRCSALSFEYTGKQIDLDNISIIKFNRSRDLYIDDGSNIVPIMNLDSTTPYYDSIKTDKVLNLKYDSASGNYIYSDGEKPIKLIDSILTCGFYLSAQTILNRNTPTGQPDAWWARLKTNYDNFYLTTKTNPVTISPQISHDYWWKVLPYAIPIGTKLIEMQLRYSRGYISGIVVNITIDKIKNVINMDAAITSYGGDGDDHYQYNVTQMDNFQPHLLTDLPTTRYNIANDNLDYTIKFDDYFIYTLPVSHNGDTITVQKIKFYR
jgi:hypothetical protein